LIIGQKNIHDKIQQLNFRDCHAKISYVDAQATLGDGVVVQVSGELSNDGHPMRRFTQTFVLACQSPKKYYVHNDIFRYQDMYNEDDDAVRAGEDHDTNDSNATNDSTGSMIVPQNATVFYQAPSNVVVTNPAIIPNFPPQAGQVNGVMHDEMLKNISTQTTQSPQQILNAQATIITQVAQTIPMAPAPTSLPLPVEPVAVIASDSVPIMADNNMYDGDQSHGE
jgi:Nuclear transport factor 2 (NTF2) domain